MKEIYKEISMRLYGMTPKPTYILIDRRLKDEALDYAFGMTNIKFPESDFEYMGYKVFFVPLNKNYDIVKSV